MATTKKPNKKYVPKLVRYPSLVTQHNSFGPFESALDRLLDTGESEMDEYFILTYKDGTGNNQSYFYTLETYIKVSEIYASRAKLTYDFSSLRVLQNRVFDALVIDEEEVLRGKEALKICKKIISSIPYSLLKDIITTIRTSTAISKVTATSTREDTLRRFKEKIGDLPIEEVRVKANRFQTLHLEDPTNLNLVRLVEAYSGYLEAYRC
jgi:hypothetical protein